ncbi:unsaturated chondroitin disaccharide hydrolase [Streptomyces sp. PvR006]|uniref:sugar ABC transporter permease n=1 Tax=Streptomyces sp. PvR006 TaxID=2817860 RepID=UPI001FD9600C|nr:sugar ABC transporter permease [Streptomyces sp. PvR006]MBP2586126.1 unsaturated chondroitin disaccharide hydrolase [Streptomyces sp. PvR006]
MAPTGTGSPDACDRPSVTAPESPDARDRSAATAPDWAEEALGLLLERVGETAEQVGDRFPLYADPADGRWTTTGRGSWTGGFWAGLLWLRAGRTGSADNRAAAAAVTGRLAPWAGADTSTRGLILWYGTALGAGDPTAQALRERAAKAAVGAFDPELGLVPWGSALGGERLRARTDGVPGLVPLLASAGPEGREAAARHLHRHLDLCLPRDGTGRPAPAWRLDRTRGWLAEDDPAPGWTRGEAWLLLAVADALLRADTPAWRADRLPAAAELLLADCGMLDGPLVPPADARRPDGPADSSAAAITAVALLKLALVPGAVRPTVWAARARAVLHRLAHDHLTRPGGTRPAGMLLDGCYDARGGTAVRHELVWGDFFLALGLAALLGRADLRRV